MIVVRAYVAYCFATFLSFYEIKKRIRKVFKFEKRNNR